MCCCSKPTINGEHGYSWDGKTVRVRPIDPPDIGDAELIFDEPGRCGGLDCHSHHYRVVKQLGTITTITLLVRHGGGDESISISNGKAFVAALKPLDTNARYWVLSAMFYAQSHAARDAANNERLYWRKAAAEKRIKTRKCRDYVKVWIESSTGNMESKSL